MLEKRNSDPEKKAKGKLFDHILVDEFQDISILDLNFLRELAKHNGVDITVIGDDDQAIYEWRAATPEIILNPQKYLERSIKRIL
jgi:DNA helicase-2/ATP-dependent DNA helicase PcrA